MLGQPPKALSDVVDFHPRDGWGDSSTYTVRFHDGATSGVFYYRQEAFALARKEWPELADDEDN